MPKVNKCPVCNKPVELVPDPNDPQRVVGLCNHGEAWNPPQIVISQPAPEQPAEKSKTGVKKNDQHLTE
jgi:hypothetical protein